MTRNKLNILKSKMLTAVCTPVCDDYSSDDNQCENLRIVIYENKGPVRIIAQIGEFRVLNCLNKKGDPKRHILQLFDDYPNNPYDVEPVSLCSR